MQQVALAAAVAAVLAAPALAGLVPPGESRFSADAVIYLKGDPFASVGNDGDSLGYLAADLDNQLVGDVMTWLQSSESQFSVSSQMGTNMEVGAEGSSYGSGYYSIDGTQPLLVDWAWSNVGDQGGWRVLDANNNVVASLTFVAGQFVSTGGSFGSDSTGNTSLNLSAGDYKLEAFFFSVQMPSSSNVTFSFGAIPTPGAVALVGIAGALTGGRRRR